MSTEEHDPRAKYRHLPAPIDLADTIASVDTSIHPDEIDATDGATPYLRSTLGPWIR